MNPLTPIIGRLSQHCPKPVLFALLGAIGCLLGAVFGEVLAQATASPAAPAGPRPTLITLLIDCSGSMNANNRMAETKEAAAAFVQRTDFSRDVVGLVGFSSRAAELVPPSTQAAPLLQAIAELQPLQFTAMDAGLAQAAEQISRSSSGPGRDRAILLFTDGVPEDGQSPRDVVVARTRSVAESVRKLGIRLVAVGTGDANAAFLAELTGDPGLVFFAQQGGFENAFRQAEKALRRVGLIGSEAHGASFGRSLVRNVGWAVLIAVGLALLLIVGQNAYQRRALWDAQTLPSALLGSAMAGVVAGVVAQVGLQVIATSAAGASLAGWCRIPAWAALGALLGRGMARVVPNLKRQSAMKGGAIGGAAASLALLGVAAVLGEGPARFIGAAILGASIGYAIAWMEQHVREASLVVHWGPNESSILSLGADPVVLGSSRQAHVYLAADKGFPPVAGLVSLENGQVQFENRITAQRYTLRNGSKLQLSNVLLEVQTA